jgi:hypothetical protein
MNYDRFFADALQRVREEHRYRIFADLERLTGLFPHATWAFAARSALPVAGILVGVRSPPF